MHDLGFNYETKMLDNNLKTAIFYYFHLLVLSVVCYDEKYLHQFPFNIMK